jgi:prepilin-type N-terminal cleavage/methylation domain-containing protein/prepilin-type processing-associated H-X9-DG protein
MRRSRAFTLVELLVVIAIIALLLSILMPSLQKAKEGAARVVCLSNEKQLSLAWLTYAQDNRDKIVYGGTLAVGGANGLTGADITFHAGEIPWAYHSNPSDSPETQKANITTGALYPYLKDVKIYRCPVGEKGKLRTYSIVDGLNSIAWMAGTQNILVKNLTTLKRPGERAVFIDEGGGAGTYISTMGWCVQYASPRWLDPPPFRHKSGTTLSFADGHAENRLWKDGNTRVYTEAVIAGRTANGFQPKNLDLQYMQKAVWGGLGYDPGQIGR